MAQAPIMPLFTDALIGDTMHLTTEEFGAYLLILIATWRNNGSALRDDDIKMSRIIRCGLNRWRTKIKPRLIEFFDISDGLWHQKRLEKEWVTVLENKKKQAIKGRLSGVARSLKKLEIERTDVGQRFELNANPLILKKEEEEDSDSPSGESAATSAANDAQTPEEKIAPEESIDPVKALWSRGLKLLLDAGVPEKQARGLMGKWRREFGDAAVMVAIAAAENELATEPISFISACLANSRAAKESNGNGRHPPNTAATERFLASRQATLDAVFRVEQRNRTRETGDRETDCC
jgi:uncharacterized protein YdaU (DUF1376 family)